MNCLDGFVAKMLASDEVWPPIGAKLPSGEVKLQIREIWKYMIGKVIAQCGPFAGVPKSDHLDELVSTEVRLLPWGLPRRNMGWRRPLGVGNSEYVACVRAVFARAVHSPISDSCVSSN